MIETVEVNEEDDILKNVVVVWGILPKGIIKLRKGSWKTMWKTLLGVKRTISHSFWKMIILVGTYEKGLSPRILKEKKRRRKKIKF